MLHGVPLNKSSPLDHVAQLIRNEISENKFHEFVDKCGRLVLLGQVANLKRKICWNWKTVIQVHTAFTAMIVQPRTVLRASISSMFCTAVGEKPFQSLLREQNRFFLHSRLRFCNQLDQADGLFLQTGYKRVA